MADLFISYARADKNFVHELQQALSERGRNAWVDWRDIPPTAEWLQEIFAGIEAATAVVFVLSPEFLASTYCSLELEHAIACKKRLIPIVRSDVDHERVNRALAALNWIYFRESDDFEAALTTLLKALDTDLEYDRQSTRLLVRAREWETRKRADAATLRGIELEEAERWLAQGSNKTPSPTSLQVVYITASRRAAGRRQRRLLTGVSAALAVTLVLSIVSFALYQVAQRQEEIAQTNYKHALTRQLAAQSRNYDSSQRDLAMLLAVEAYRRDPTSGEAADAMLRELQTPRLAGFIQDYTHVWASVAFSPNGKVLAAGSPDGTVVLWNVATRRSIGNPIAADSRNQGAIQVAFSSDGRLLATMSGDSQHTSLRIWDVSTHHLVATPQQFANELLTDIAFSPNSDQFAVAGCLLNGYAGDLPVITLLNVSTGTSITLRYTGLSSGASETSSCSAGSIAFSPNGSLVAAGVYGSVLIWNVATGTLFKVLPNVVGPMAFSPSGSLLAVGGCGKLSYPTPSSTPCVQGAVQLWNVFTGQLDTTLVGGAIAVNSVAFSPDGKELAGALIDNSIVVWNLDDGGGSYTIAAHPGIPGQVATQEIAFSPSGDLVASASKSDLNVSLWNLSTVQPQPLATPLPQYPDQPPPSSHTISIADAAISPNGKLVAATGCTKSAGLNPTETATMWLWNPSSYQQSGELRAGSNACGELVAFSSDNTNLALLTETVGSSSESIQLWQTTSHQFVGKPWPVAAGVYALAFSPNGKVLAGGGCLHSGTGPNLVGQLWLRNIVTGHVDQLAWKGQIGCVSAIAFSPDGQTLATGICLDFPSYDPCPQSEILLWDVVHQRPVGQPITGDWGTVQHLWISLDGKRFAAQVLPVPLSVSVGGTIFWDITTRRQIRSLPLPNAQPPFEDGAISSDWLVTAATYCLNSNTIPQCERYDSSTIQLHDVQENHDIGLPLTAPGIGATQSLLLGAGNQTLVSWSRGGGSLLVWDIDPASWAARICQTVGRNLTRDEWNLFLTARETYRPTCPAMPRAPGT